MPRVCVRVADVDTTQEDSMNRCLGDMSVCTLMLSMLCACIGQSRDVDAARLELSAASPLAGSGSACTPPGPSPEPTSCVALEDAVAPSCLACAKSACGSQLSSCDSSCSGLVGCVAENCQGETDVTACAVTKCSECLGGASGA